MRPEITRKKLEEYRAGSNEGKKRQGGQERERKERGRCQPYVPQPYLSDPHHIRETLVCPGLFPRC